MLIYLVEGVELRLVDREEVTKLEEPKLEGVELRLIDREEVAELVVLLDS